MRILVSTGEVSGDVAGALVVRCIRERAPDVELFGIGGRRLAEAGVEILRQTNHLGSVGFTETFAAVPALGVAFRRLSRAVRARRPAAALLIGNDLFNCLLARLLRRRGVRVIAYFPPQVWLWRSLVRPIGSSYDAVLTSFPEEQEIYSARGAKAHFIGHYLAAQLRAVDEAGRRGAREALGLDTDAPVVALLPGSRTLEVRKLGPLLFAAAAELLQAIPALRFVVPVAEPRFAEPLAALAAARGLSAVVRLVEESHGALAASDLALMASGTASLEAALLGVPMVLTYRLSLPTIASVKLIRALGLIDAETVGLPNLLLGGGTVPELRQRRATAPAIAAEALALLGSPERRATMRSRLAAIAPLLAGADPLGAVADCVLAYAVDGAWPRPQTSDRSPVSHLVPSWSR